MAFNQLNSKKIGEIKVAYVYLLIAIIGEVAATSALKASNGFTQLTPSLIVAVGYGIAFYFLSLVLKSIAVGIAYAIWAGLGIVLVALLGAMLYKQVPDFAAVLGMAFIVVGVIIIHLFSSTLIH